MLIYLLHPRLTERLAITKLAVSIVKFPQLLSEPINISVSDNNYTTTVFHETGSPMQTFFIPTFKLLMAYHKRGIQLKLIMQTATFDFPIKNYKNF